MPRLAFLSTAHIHTESFLKRNAERGCAPPLIWDDVPERGRDFAQRHGAEFTAEIDTALTAAVDGYVICAENTRHRALLEAVLPRGRPTFCEKPLCVDPADLDPVLDLVARHGTPLTCGYFMPFSAAMQGLAAALDERSCGTVTHVRHRNAHPGAYRRWFDSPTLRWFTEPALSGGGALLDLGTHSVHLLRSLFGPVEAVWAAIGNRSGVYPAVDDHGLIHLRFASGVLGSVEAAWIHLGGRGGLEVFGDQAALWQEGDGFERKPIDGEAAPLPVGEAVPDRIDRLLALIGGEIPEAAWRADLDCCADAVRILAAAYHSSTDGGWVVPAA